MAEQDNFQPEMGFKSIWRHKTEKDLDFLADFVARFSGRSARTVQRPKGGVPDHPENQQEMALRKNTAPDDYAVSDLFINEAVNN